MRVSVLAANVFGLAAVATILAGCSSGALQTPAASGANSLGQSAEQRAIGLRPSAPNTSPGFMQKTGGSTSLAYMSSWGSGAVVDVFTLNGTQVGQITNGLFVPQGLFVDAKGSLWVANLNNVLVFPHNGLTATTTLNDPVGDPIDVTVCPNGTAYVADFYDNDNTSVASIQVYPPGNTSPTASLTYSGESRNPYLTCDAAGNVFTSIMIGQSIGDGRVIEFPLGQQAGAKDIGISLQDPGGIKPDNAGNLLVTDLVGHTITEYTESGTPTGVSIATVNPIEGIALTRKRQDDPRCGSERSRWAHLVVPGRQARARVHLLRTHRTADAKYPRRRILSRAKGHLTQA